MKAAIRTVAPLAVLLIIGTACNRKAQVLQQALMDQMHGGKARATYSQVRDALQTEWSQLADIVSDLQSDRGVEELLSAHPQVGSNLGGEVRFRAVVTGYRDRVLPLPRLMPNTRQVSFRISGASAGEVELGFLNEKNLSITAIWIDGSLAKVAFLDFAAFQEPGSGGLQGEASISPFFLEPLDSGNGIGDFTGPGKMAPPRNP
jgi:hypothetical protein